jgi:hypothetical protein
MPSVALPTEKIMLPVGSALPLAGFTIASSWVVAVELMFDGVAVMDVVVTKAGPVTVIATEPDEIAKFPFGE